jgi:CheY-like chemotaxis protein
MPGGGKLSIVAAQRGDRIAIAVRDTGTGMPPEVQERALEPFFTTKGPGEGTGLGLSMAYGVARQAGGELTIDSEEGRGTTVTMQLPCAPDADAAEDTGNAAAPVVRGASCRVLLVDDDVQVRSTLADVLESQGHRVVQANSGSEALALLESEGADLMLLDFAMPGLNGAQVAEQAQKRWPQLKLVFITGFADSAAIDQAVAGRARVLKKPVSSAELASAISEMLP